MMQTYEIFGFSDKRTYYKAWMRHPLQMLVVLNLIRMEFESRCEIHQAKTLLERRGYTVIEKECAEAPDVKESVKQ